MTATRCTLHQWNLWHNFCINVLHQWNIWYNFCINVLYQWNLWHNFCINVLHQWNLWCNFCFNIIDASHWYRSHTIDFIDAAHWYRSYVIDFIDTEVMPYISLIQKLYHRFHWLMKSKVHLVAVITNFVNNLCYYVVNVTRSCVPVSLVIIYKW
jgi:hypothetical protein